MGAVNHTLREAKGIRELPPRSRSDYPGWVEMSQLQGLVVRSVSGLQGEGP